MTHRYRTSEWKTLKRAMPPPLAERCAAAPDPPGFVRVVFGDETCRRWVEDRLGPGLAPLGGENATVDRRFARFLVPHAFKMPPGDPNG